MINSCVPPPKQAHHGFFMFLFLLAWGCNLPHSWRKMTGGPQEQQGNYTAATTTKMTIDYFMHFTHTQKQLSNKQYYYCNQHQMITCTSHENNQKTLKYPIILL